MKNHFLGISITTPSYNQGQFLGRAIESVLSQSYAQLEYLVFDGGSTDGSLEIIREYADRISFWTSKSDLGQSDAINKGWRRSTGEIIGWLNSDDYLLSGTLETVAHEFQANPSLVALVGSCLIVDADGKITGRKYAREFDLPRLIATSGGVPGQPAVFLRRCVMDDVGYLDTHLHYTMDWEYWIRLALRYPPQRIKVLYKPLAALRLWEGTKTTNGVIAICEEHRKTLKGLFATGGLPAGLQRLKSISESGTYWKQADLEWKAHMITPARKSARRAAGMVPSLHAIMRLVVFLISTFFSPANWNKIRRIKLYWQRRRGV